jgi:UDP-2-acetamido-3-amino-2,3-dideoxy-glucuronate N-acetyltransferase
MTGALTLANKDKPVYALVVGNPGRVVGWVSEAGKKLKFDEDGKAFCEKSGRTYTKIGELITSD